MLPIMHNQWPFLSLVVWPLLTFAFLHSGTEHVRFSPTRKTSRAPSAKRREVFGESHEGMKGDLHPSKNLL